MWLSIFVLWFAWKIVLLQYRKQLVVALLDKAKVVICLKNRTFAVSQTTLLDTGRKDGELWFAWKIVLLQYRKQRPYGSVRKRNRCDLLEKSYFCSIANNLYFTPWLLHLLWFAWKIVLLQYRKQHHRAVACIQYGCDLLEKSYFCSIANNQTLALRLNCRVVICLKNRTFAVSQTTINI